MVTRVLDGRRRVSWSMVEISRTGAPTRRIIISRFFLLASVKLADPQYAIRPSITNAFMCKLPAYASWPYLAVSFSPSQRNTCAPFSTSCVSKGDALLQLFRIDCKDHLERTASAGTQAPQECGVEVHRIVLVCEQNNSCRCRYLRQRTLAPRVNSEDRHVCRWRPTQCRPHHELSRLCCKKGWRRN